MGTYLSGVDCANIIIQILSAVNFLHCQGIVHRDLKLDNILVQLERLDDERTTMICKVTDFGFAQAIERNEKFDLFLGTPLYMAPVIYLKKAYDSKVDIWAIGVIAHILLSGIAPFPGHNKD